MIIITSLMMLAFFLVNGVGVFFAIKTTKILFELKDYTIGVITGILEGVMIAFLVGFAHFLIQNRYGILEWIR